MKDKQDFALPPRFSAAPEREAPGLPRMVVAKPASFCSGSAFVPPSPGLWDAMARTLGKCLGNNSSNFWAQCMEFILRGDEGEKGVNLYFVGNLYRAEGERKERRKIPRGLLRFGGLWQRCRL